VPLVANFALKKRKRPTLDFLARKHPVPGQMSLSEYDVFAVLNGLRIMQHRWPQGFAVSVMRRVRPELEKQHPRILKQNPTDLFDQKEIVKRARPGDIAVDNTDPVFLSVVSKVRDAAEGLSTRPACAVCRGVAEAAKFIRNEHAEIWTMFEVVTLAHKLHEELEKTEPRRRGPTVVTHVKNWSYLTLNIGSLFRPLADA
jgi:hypothetical protein